MLTVGDSPGPSKRTGVNTAMTNRLRRPLDRGHRLQARQNRDELVASHSKQYIPLAQGSAQAARELDQIAVTSSVAKPVIDPLELVAIDHEDSKHAPRPLCDCDLAVHGLLKQQSVR